MAKAWSKEWMSNCRQAIQSDPEYKEIAKSWEGDVSWVINADPERGIPDPIYLYEDFSHGEVHEFRICDKAKADMAEFKLTGDYRYWKQISHRDLDPTKAILQGKIKLNGDLPYVVNNSRVTAKLADIISCLDTEWPDGEYDYL